MELGLVLLNVSEHAVHGEAVVVGPHRRVTGQAHHALGGDALAADGFLVVTVLRAPWHTGFLRCCEGVVAFVGPVRNHVLEGRHQLVGLEALGKVATHGGKGLVGLTGEHVDFTIVVDGAEHGVEVDRPVEEAPGDVTHQSAEEDVDRHLVDAPGPLDMREVLIAAELEGTSLERTVAGDVVCGRSAEVALKIGPAWGRAGER